MSQSPQSAGDGPVVSRSAAYTEFGKALRLYVGRGCRFSYKDLARKSGVPARMIEAYRHDPDHEEFRPAAFEHILSLAAAIGPEFTADWLALAQQGAFWLPDDEDPSPGDMALGASEDSTEIVRRAADGVFCGKDRVALAAVGQRKIERGQRLVAMAKRRAA